ncbi:hypothetical protein [Candidatus Nitrospira bockiana]
MKRRSWKGMLGAALVILVSAQVGWTADKTTITFKVTEQGLMTNDAPVVEKRLTLRAGTRVKLIFEHADSNRNLHQFTVTSLKTEMKSRAIGPDGPKTASMEFTVGERGEDFYRISCELPCLAMEELTDYLILVDRKAPVS